jgi:hypothetical protein
MTVQQALEALVKKGAQIEQINENSFKVYDNGFWGFLEYVEPFIVKGDDILEMFEMYCQ